MSIYISHKVGWCPLCGAPILDNGRTDDPEEWQHAWIGRHGREDFA
jgi:hypothetical protein